MGSRVVFRNHQTDRGGERERRGWQERTKLKEEEEEEVGTSFVLLWRRRRVAGMEE
jgi:hypothetical protein